MKCWNHLPEEIKKITDGIIAFKQVSNVNFLMNDINFPERIHIKFYIFTIIYLLQDYMYTDLDLIMFTTFSLLVSSIVNVSYQTCRSVCISVFQLCFSITS